MEALDVGNPPVPLIFSLIIHALIPLSAAADVPICARAEGLSLLLIYLVFKYTSTLITDYEAT